ncbi:MAG TPA: cytochrome c/FTR1 family iron permease [Gemmatimonadaceae bacterium]|nr:cytochrome c/FTR1 family iron permease [Gemmatimonadaceae bacterium]
MRFSTRLGFVAAAYVLAGLPARGLAQENPVQRVASIVSVAVEEYGKGIDAQGRLTSNDEYREAVGFLQDARDAALRLSGDRALAARAILDSIITAVDAKKPPSALAPLAQRFSTALGSGAALELPTKPLDLADGRKLFEANCASCHGALGGGDGPAAANINPKPPALGDERVMNAVTPAMMFRKISVGVTGTAMPAWASKLTADQRWNVVAYLESLRRTPEQVAEGEGLYAQNCLECHGAAGLSDGALARSLSKLPPEVGSFARQAEKSDSLLADMVANGTPGTPMPPSRQLSPAQVQSVVAYLRNLSARGGTTAIASNDSGSADAAAKLSLSLLEQSLTAARNGRMNDAADRAFDAYIAFEPIESPARARNPGVVSSMERLFADFKGAVKANDLHGAERARDAIEANMPNVVELTRPAGSGSEAFLQSLLIILREGFEAILVIGAVVAFLLKTGHRERLRSIWWGIVLGLVASGLTAVVLRTVLTAIPASQEIIEGVTLLVAVAVLFSVSYWLISRVEAAKWQQFIREKVNNALAHGGGNALAFVAFLAVYREGAETALFYQALFNEGAHVVLPISLGIVAGFVGLAVIFTLFYKFGVKIPLRPFFSVTSILLYYMAFVFIGKGVRELQEGNAMPISLIPGFPTVEALGIYPTWQTVLAQLLLLGLLVFAVMKTFWPKRSVTLPTVSPNAAPAADAISAELAALRAENARLAARLEVIESAIEQPGG